MASSGTLPRATADEALTALLVDHRLVAPELVDDVRAALAHEPNGMGLVEALLDAGAVDRETVQLFVADIERGVLTCPGCGGRFNVGKLAPGTRFKCKSCGAPVRVPAARITRAVLGASGGAARGVTIEEASVKASALAEDALEAAMAGGTAEGQLLDFRGVDVSAGASDRAPRAKSERPRRASKRDEAAIADGEPDEEPEKPPDPHFWHRFVILVVIPIVVMALGMYYTREIKAFLFGQPAEDRGTFSVQDTTPRRRGGGPGAPSTPVEQSVNWKTAQAAGEAAMALLTQARAAVAAGDTATAVGHFDAASAKFQEAFDAFDEVHDQYGGATGALQARVDAWDVERQKADAERAAASGG